MMQVVLLSDDFTGAGDTGPTPPVWETLSKEFPRIHRGLIVRPQDIHRRFDDGTVVPKGERSISTINAPYAAKHAITRLRDSEGCEHVLFDEESNIWPALASPRASVADYVAAVVSDAALLSEFGRTVPFNVKPAHFGMYGRPWYGLPNDPKTIVQWSKADLACRGMRHIEGVRRSSTFLCTTLYQKEGTSDIQYAVWSDRALSALDDIVQSEEQADPGSAPPNTAACVCPLVVDSLHDAACPWSMNVHGMLLVGERIVISPDILFVWLAPRAWRGTIAPSDSHANDLWAVEKYRTFLARLASEIS